MTSPTDDEYDAAHREEREAAEALRAAAIRYADARHRLNAVLNTTPAADNPTYDEWMATYGEERAAAEALHAASLPYAAARHRLDTVLNTPEEQQ